MPPLPPFEYTGPLDCSPAASIDKSVVQGKSIIITGGGSGLGESYTRAFAKAGAFVTIGDVNVAAGEKLAAEFPKNVQFVKCDVTSWDDQLAMFKKAISTSPANSCDIVIANAGIVGMDPIIQIEERDEPTKPNLAMTEVNVVGVLYSVKLALHYFSKQPDTPERDRCLILGGSIAGYIDQAATIQYTAGKFALRGLLRTLRSTVWVAGVRVNLIAPWYIKTQLMAPEIFQLLEQSGAGFAETQDATMAIFRMATDQTVAGRALAIVPREVTPNGYMDINHDHFEEGDVIRPLQLKCLAFSQSVIEATMLRTTPTPGQSIGHRHGLPQQHSLGRDHEQGSGD